MGSTKRVWAILCAMMALAGCGGAVPARAPDGGARGGAPSYGAAAPLSAGAEGSASGAKAASGAADEWLPSPPPARAPTEALGDRDAAAERSPETRPGLGTEWGETRASRVHDVTFVRASSRPFAIATIHYDDLRGVAAMANLVARRERESAVPAGGGAVTISIRDAEGTPFEAIRSGDRTMVVGEAGETYSIVLTNHTGRRIESVVTVDGLDVIDGRPGTLDKRGYVLLPYATVEIDGFRQSMDAVAAFRFASVGASYAAQMGSARDVGVIGVALFSERGDREGDAWRRSAYDSDVRLRDTATPFPADPRFARPPLRR